MAAKPNLTTRLGQLAAVVPLVLLVWAVVGWGLRTDAAVRTLQAHDTQLNATDRMARLEEGQRDTTKRLDRIERLLDILVGRNK